MKTRTALFAVSLALGLSLTPASVAPRVAQASTDVMNAKASPQQQEPYGALERGYRTGYSDGYQTGWSDSLKRATADYRGKADYQRADRAYIAAYGQLEDYRDGYQQGFASGYDSGYSHRGFDSVVPAGGLTRHGATAANDNTTGSDAASVAGNGNGRGGRSSDDQANDESSSSAHGSATSNTSASGSVSTARVVPANTVLTVELSNRLSTDVSQRGDRFEARVIEPQEFAGAIVSGRISNLQRPGKSRGRAQLQLDFDQIQLHPNGDSQNFNAQVIEVVNRGGSDNVGDVDAEGGVRGKDSTKDDVAKVGAGAGIGAVIGAIAGGGKGAAIGAIIGGGAGSAGVLTQRGKDIRLDAGQQLRIRSTGR